jgi:multidrug efflux pump subunit AcrB
MRCRWLVLAGLLACHKSSAAGPTLEVRVEYPGGSVTDVEAAVTTPVERICGRLPRVTRMHGYSLPERSLVTLELERGVDPDDSLRLLQEELKPVGQLLPREANFPVVTRGEGPIVARYTVRSESLPVVQLGELVDAAFSQPVAQTSGVGRVQACGRGRRRITVDVDPTLLGASGMTFAEVSDGLAKPGGGTPEALAPLVLRYANGAPVRLKDVARIQDDASNPDCRAFDERGPVVEMVVRAEPVANPDEVRKAIDPLAHNALVSLPPGVELRARTVERTLVVDLDPDSSAPARAQLQRAVAGVAGVGSFLIEVGPRGEADPPSIARVLLASKDDALAGRVLAALHEMPFVRGAGEPNATVELEAPGWPQLESAAADLFRALSARGELVLRLGVDRHPEPQVRVDPDAASRLGVSMAEVALALRAREGMVVSTYFTATGTLPVVLHVGGALDQLFVKGSAGPVPLTALARVQTENLPVTLRHAGQFPVIGARVQTRDLSGLRKAYVPPPDVHMQVWSD